MKTLIAVVLALGLFGAKASALSVSIGGGKVKSTSRSVDSNGNPIAFNDDKAWKVFELYGTTEVQVTDEASVAPKNGILHKVCVISGNPVLDFALVWDTSTQTGGVTVANRRLLPPLYPLSVTQMTCTTDLNALFTAGLRGANSQASGIMYIYWRGLGDRN